MNYKIKNYNKISLKKWIEKQNIVTIINSKDIILTEEIHLNAKEIDLQKNLGKYVNKNVIDKIIIVKKIETNKYSLLLGLKSFLIAKALNKPVNAVILENGYTREQLIKELPLIDNSYKAPKDTESFCKIEDIIIPERFLKSTPHKVKVDYYKNFYKKSNCIDKSITVIKNKGKYILVNGYIRYKVLKELNNDIVPIKFTKNNNSIGTIIKINNKDYVITGKTSNEIFCYDLSSNINNINIMEGFKFPRNIKYQKTNNKIRNINII